MKCDLLWNYDFEFHENTSGERQIPVEKKRKRVEEGKYTQCFTEFLEQCKIKATFN